MSKDTTHNFIHEQALKILDYDKGTSSLFASTNNVKVRKYLSVYDDFKAYKKVFIEHANDPDNDAFEKSLIIEYRKLESWGMKCEYISFPTVPTYSSHFYNLKTSANYTSCLWKESNGLFFNAIRMFTGYADNAVALNKKNKKLNKDVIISLSRACHYLEDMGESHHVTNKISRKEYDFLVSIFKTSTINEILKKALKISLGTKFNIITQKPSQEALDFCSSMIDNFDISTLKPLLSNHKEFESYALKKKMNLRLISKCLL